MEKIKLNVVGLSYSSSDNGVYALILQEERNERKLPIIMSRTDAMSVAFSLENKKHFRPFTHDLLFTILDKMKGRLLEVILTKVEAGVFFADIFIAHAGEVFVVTARPSDAIALAVKYHSPVYATVGVVEKASFEFEEEFEKKEGQEAEEEGLQNYSIQTIKNMLEEAIENENYEEAGKLKKELDKRM